MVLQKMLDVRSHHRWTTTRKCYTLFQCCVSLALMLLVLPRQINGADINCTAPDFYLCNDEVTCLLRRSVCDDFPDCPDGDDEAGCVYGHRRLKAEEACRNADEWRCSDEAYCIKKDEICNGVKDCLDGSDEHNCTAKMCKTYLCHNRDCLERREWVCDGKDDCGDNSDEMHCESNCTLDNGMFMCKDNSSCLTLNLICDGHLNCADGSDEQDYCHKKELCVAKKCPSDKCILMPWGAECYCGRGYSLNKITNTCEDVDECRIYGMCSQGCTNTIGSYNCTCLPEFTLMSDNKSCALRNAGEPHMYLCTDENIYSYSPQSRREFLLLHQLIDVISITGDDEYIYWTDIEGYNQKVSRLHRNRTDVEVVVLNGVGQPEGIALDWWTKNIYYTDKLYHQIVACTAIGHSCVTLIDQGLDSPRSIAVYPNLAKMYWTDWGSSPHIGVAAMDGRNVQILVSKDVHWPNGLTIDYPNDRLYWLDAKSEKIETVRLNGEDRRIVKTNVKERPFSIDVFMNTLYWTDINTETLQSCDKFTGKNHKILEWNRGFRDLYIHHPAVQTYKPNHPCAMSPCSHICLLAADNGYRCACPADMYLRHPGHTCMYPETRERLLLGNRNYLLIMNHLELGRIQPNDAHHLDVTVNRLAYNPVQSQVIVADNKKRIIVTVDLDKFRSRILIGDRVGKVEAMEVDEMANNLYWTDSIRTTVEVYSFTTKKRAILQHFQKSDTPYGLVVIPEVGKMFVALNNGPSELVKVALNGRGQRYKLTEFKSKYPLYVAMVADRRHRLIYLTVGDRLLTYDYDKNVDRLFRNHLGMVNEVAMVNGTLYWTGGSSGFLNWANYDYPLMDKHISVPKVDNWETYASTMPIATMMPANKGKQHPCMTNNGDCSHICVSMGGNSHGCVCPPGMIFKSHHNTTCIDEIDCEFKCNSEECITRSRVCNGFSDCADDSDELDCDKTKFHSAQYLCNFDQFKCVDGTRCLEMADKCNGHQDCADGSDEVDCDRFNFTTRCHVHQFACNNTRCVDLSVICDQMDDCEDGSDEMDCNKKHKVSKCGEEDFFTCTSGQCIDKHWLCDGFMDCVDGSDEHDQCPVVQRMDKMETICEMDHFQCTDMSCIEMSLKCDGHADCSDGSDEMDCLVMHGSRGAGGSAGGGSAGGVGICLNGGGSSGYGHELSCQSNQSICIPHAAICNGTAECPRGEDEMNCSKCHNGGFECKNGRCIQAEFVCDSEDDCGDKSDEIDCSFMARGGNIAGAYGRQNDAHKLDCTDDMFHCDTNTCIESRDVCNGFADCPNGKDESPQCKSACVKSGCDHFCTPTPTGGICSCRRGYELWTDKKSCVDTNECVATEPCAQLCDNVPGSYRCSCFPNFMLRSDKHSCKAMGPTKYLLYATHNQIRKVIPLPSATSIFWSTNNTKITGMAVDMGRELVYASEMETGTVYQINARTKGVVSLSNVGRPEHVAVDWISGNIYVLDNFGAGVPGIKMCNFAAKACALILKFRKNDVIRKVGVDANNRYLFYNVDHLYLFGMTESKLYRSHLDGTVSVVVRDPFVPSDVFTLDVNKQRIFYMDPQTMSIKSMDYNGGRESVVIKRDSNLITGTIIGMELYEDKLVMTSIGHSYVVHCQVYGGAAKKCSTHQVSAANIEDLVMVQRSQQRMEQNVCEGHKCSVLCVRADRGPKCICHSSRQVAMGDVCPKVTDTGLENIVYDGTWSSGTEDAEEQDGGGSAGQVVLILFIVLALIAGAVYFILKKRPFGPRFTVSNHFSNISLETAQRKISGPVIYKPSVNTDPKTHEGNEVTLEVEPLQQQDLVSSTVSDEESLDSSGREDMKHLLQRHNVHW